MAEQLLPNEVTEYPAEDEESGPTGNSEGVENGEEPRPSRKCCCCLSHRVGALLIGVFVSIANIVFIILCIILLLNEDIKVFGYNEKFNYVFMITINAIMLISNFLIIRGAIRQQQKFVMAWVLVYAVLAFLENVVGFAAFILAMVAHASAWAAVPFLLLLVIDAAYVYCIVHAHHYCKSLEGYTVFP